ncbi:hypothetical protein K0M31_014728 [Melipona bicolor]|uniref:Uncharacterized protein n=1 Tax=Melipona bicolor TaxID=60889 RepID=A0AA40FGR0_9HYME|nr:hypothetical protein K0M31_014728 [Melipona bicolor]
MVGRKVPERQLEERLLSSRIRVCPQFEFSTVTGRERNLVSELQNRGNLSPYPPFLSPSLETFVRFPLRSSTKPALPNRSSAENSSSALKTSVRSSANRRIWPPTKRFPAWRVARIMAPDYRGIRAANCVKRSEGTGEQRATPINWLTEPRTRLALCNRGAARLFFPSSRVFSRGSETDQSGRHTRACAKHATSAGPFVRTPSTTCGYERDTPRILSSGCSEQARSPTSASSSHLLPPSTELIVLGAMHRLPSLYVLDRHNTAALLKRL